MVASEYLLLVVLCLCGALTVQRGNAATASATSAPAGTSTVAAGITDGKSVGSDGGLLRNELHPELPGTQEDVKDGLTDAVLSEKKSPPETEEKAEDDGDNDRAEGSSEEGHKLDDPKGQGKDVAHHSAYTKDSTSQTDSDGGRDDSSVILQYSIPVTAVALVVVCTALIVRCRSWRADRRKKFGPGTEMSLKSIFSKNKMKGFHRLSTDSDSEEQSDASVF